MLRKLGPSISIGAALILFSVVCIKAAIPAAPQEPDAVVVKMTPEHVFAPDKLTIKSGQSVEWVNDEPGGLHQVTDDANIAADPGNASVPEGAEAFDSRMIRSGKSFKHEFTTPGVYKYVCPPHESSGMIGQITVTK